MLLATFPPMADRSMALAGLLVDRVQVQHKIEWRHQNQCDILMHVVDRK